MVKVSFGREVKDVFSIERKVCFDDGFKESFSVLAHAVRAKDVVAVAGDELKINNPATASGMKSDSVYRRAK